MDNKPKKSRKVGSKKKILSKIKNHLKKRVENQKRK